MTASATSLSAVHGHAAVAYDPEGGGVGVRADAGWGAINTERPIVAGVAPAVAGKRGAAETCGDTAVRRRLVAGDGGWITGDDAAASGAFAIGKGARMTEGVEAVGHTAATAGP